MICNISVHFLNLGGSFEFVPTLSKKYFDRNFSSFINGCFSLVLFKAFIQVENNSRIPCFPPDRIVLIF